MEVKEEGFKLKEIAKDLMKIKGEVRGIVFKTDFEFVLKEKGREGFEKLRKKLEEIDSPINYEKINPMGFYPIGLRAISLLVIKNVFGFNEKKIKEIGAFAPKFSFVVKIFLKYFFSVQKMAEQVPKMWRKHYTIGELRAEVNEKERWGILRLENFIVHPILCPYLEGYFLTILKMITNSEVVSEEIKCNFKGDKFHEFFLRWGLPKK